jgi:hypothetical protein
MPDTRNAPKWPICEAPMRLARITQKVASYPELQSYECHPCRQVVHQGSLEQLGRLSWWLFHFKPIVRCRLLALFGRAYRSDAFPQLTETGQSQSC